MGEEEWRGRERRVLYGEEVGAFAGAFFLRVCCVFGIGGTPCSGVVAAGWVFDFDHFCSAGGFA